MRLPTRRICWDFQECMWVERTHDNFDVSLAPASMSSVLNQKHVHLPTCWHAHIAMWVCELDSTWMRYKAEMCTVRLNDGVSYFRGSRSKSILWTYRPFIFLHRCCWILTFGEPPRLGWARNSCSWIIITQRWKHLHLSWRGQELPGKIL